MFDDGIHWLQSWLRRPQNGKGFNSIGDLEIPEPVLEELLQNALIHLDLLKPAAIRLLIFDNRIEIINPGCLPGNQTVDDIRRGNSNPRNIQLARFCLKTLPYRGLGSGIPRAFSLDKNIELVNSQSGNQFTAIIRRMPDDDCVSHHSGQNVPQPKRTKCPPKRTKCPPKRTKCPPKRTKCPPKRTKRLKRNRRHNQQCP